MLSWEKTKGTMGEICTVTNYRSSYEVGSVCVEVSSVGNPFVGRPMMRLTSLKGKLIIRAQN